MTATAQEVAVRIESALSEGRLDEAVLDYECHQVAIDAWDAGVAAFRIGHLLDGREDAEGAMQFYRNAVTANPGMTPYRQNLAAVLFEAKCYEDAKPLLEAIVRETTDAYSLRSICLEWLSVIAQLELRPDSNGT